MSRNPIPETVSPTAAPPTDEGAPTAALELHGLGWPTTSQRIGKYLLVREIATGGMGVVFEALQDQPKRIVALKLMRSGFGSTEAIARFEHESQLLARLQHPGIAQVFEAGTHLCQGLAVPYFVMEHLRDAQFITDYARKQNLPLRKRLELMIQVCDAVQHGHEKGIIHRDLKPANILVDSSGRPKVIDFGVAHAADADQTAPPPGGSADTSKLIGTLPYMSPEQCRSGLPRDELDARSDVYSLGVVLYELLCGRLPYDIHRTNVDDATKIICQEPPQRPSKISSALRGDLEAILLKALHKDREQRYASAADLSRDLARVLRCEPVAARQSRFGYASWAWISRFFARHWITTGLVAVVLGIAAAQWIGIPLAFKWTPLGSWFEKFATARIAPSGQPLEHTRIIALSGQTNIPAIATAEGLTDVTPVNRVSLRRMHGRLMEKLAMAPPRVVVWDIKFPNETPFDADFVKGVRALKSARCDVIVAVWSWLADPAGAPLISPLIEPEVKVGAMTGVTTSAAAWRADLVVHQQAGHPPKASPALLAAAAYQRPGDELAVQFERLDDNAIGMHFFSPDVSRPGAPPVLRAAELWRITRFEQLSQAYPETGLKYGARVGSLIVDVPADAVLNAASIEYGAAIGAAPSKLKELFAGQVVLIGDARPEGGDGPFSLPDGRTKNGFVVQATAIDSLIRGNPVQLPITREWWFGALVPDMWLIDAAAAILGVLVAWVAFRSHPRFALLLALAMAWLLFASLAAYLKLHYLCNPIIPLVALLVAAGVTVAAERFRHRVCFLA
jgi:CHASE2 domain-containing sensor protein